MQGIDREISEKYNFEIHSITPYKETFILNTPLGRKVLKKMPFSAGRIKFIHEAKEHLINNNFNSVDRYLCTYTGEPYFLYDNSNYIIYDFIDGHECNFDNESDVQKATTLLASMHSASRGFVPSNICRVQDDLGKLPDYFKKRLDDIKKHKKQAKMGKSRFDHMFLEYFDYFCSVGEYTTSELDKTDYDKLANEARAQGMFCHHEYTHHNILFSESKSSIINFDYCCLELKVYDLANLIRRKMRKCNWDINKAKRIIDFYCSVENISSEEFKIMGLILQFPQKFWRVVNRYYNSRRSWSERSFVTKLQEVIDELEWHKKFMDNYDSLKR